MPQVQAKKKKKMFKREMESKVWFPYKQQEGPTTRTIQGHLLCRRRGSRQASKDGTGDKGVDSMDSPAHTAVRFFPASWTAVVLSPGIT